MEEDGRRLDDLDDVQCAPLADAVCVLDARGAEAVDPARGRIVRAPEHPGANTRAVSVLGGKRDVEAPSAAGRARGTD